ncbi:5-methyltetrahydropteroyltriglutamate--homocysteine S-methyltransferase [Dolosigranulum savutiense]|uniref:5-methyltetrahydropteroyltriglutamate--homocysteine methyltransferase n=1 Tax=Dolosigranulum savutiense TaxID=3110288 RepID=A0AB74TU04_9LACT
MTTSTIGFPRIGKLRELKFATQKYFKQTINESDLRQVAADLRKEHLTLQQERGIDFIPSNDFSFYDQVLDAAVLFNIVPERYRELGLSELDTYFAQARGYQGDAGDVKALALKKWYNTNYHYLVPEIEPSTEIKLVGEKPFNEFEEAKALGITTKPTVIGPFTLLKLAKFTDGRQPSAVASELAAAYKEWFARFNQLGADWVQLEEPSLVLDLTAEDKALLQTLYTELLAEKGEVKVLVQTYFGDVRDVYTELLALDIDGLGLDFVEGKQSLALVQEHGFPADKTLFAGVVNGKNIWRNNYQETLKLVKQLREKAEQIVLSTSCSLQLVPYTLENETTLSDKQKAHLAFATEKLDELSELDAILAHGTQEALEANVDLFDGSRVQPDDTVRQQVADLTEDDFTRRPEAKERVGIQRDAFNLPLLPTTTIGSFPQTAEVRKNRSDFRKGEKSAAEYRKFNEQEIERVIRLQEEIGLDVLVHGECERNDMVEFFGENLAGFLFTEKAWVQSYGTRCVKPPIIWGDVKRKEAITVDYSTYAQSLTDQIVKGMLTGPVTIFNWSFPREDLSVKDGIYQLALAIREEVLDLEAHGIKIIQIDEAALREKLPLRQTDWYSEYLDFAIPAFRLVHSGVQPETQIHTHMCYSEFEDIIESIDAMDADVISFEASRSDLSLIDTLVDVEFQTQVGPGVYDIHSPRVPSQAEIERALEIFVNKLPKENIWVNPDCGLKTRSIEETRPALENLVQAAKAIRKQV